MRLMGRLACVCPPHHLAIIFTLLCHLSVSVVANKSDIWGFYEGHQIIKNSRTSGVTQKNLLQKIWNCSLRCKKDTSNKGILANRKKVEGRCLIPPSGQNDQIFEYGGSQVEFRVWTTGVHWVERAIMLLISKLYCSLTVEMIKSEILSHFLPKSDTKMLVSCKRHLSSEAQMATERSTTQLIASAVSSPIAKKKLQCGHCARLFWKKRYLGILGSEKNEAEFQEALSQLTKQNCGEPWGDGPESEQIHQDGSKVPPNTGSPFPFALSPANICFEGEVKLQAQKNFPVWRFKGCVLSGKQTLLSRSGCGPEESIHPTEDLVSNCTKLINWLLFIHFPERFCMSGSASGSNTAISITPLGSPKMSREHRKRNYGPDSRCQSWNTGPAFWKDRKVMFVFAGREVVNSNCTNKFTRWRFHRDVFFTGQVLCHHIHLWSNVTISYCSDVTSFTTESFFLSNYRDPQSALVLPVFPLEKNCWNTFFLFILHFD